MRRLITIYTSARVILTPALVWANPNTDSPEPAFWAFAALGALPLAWVAWRSLRGDRDETPQAVRVDRG